ncbi:hypothetical protein LSH36_64g03024 [Paralvinella palmiformis]|uniref:Agmatinase n=1 Tax=Paralvinella palmiformis TaxID=53620 RepID=A0AAD9K3S5_9ANNE|nr:hypothetical protein LSH36_64g03024 [Paralvinella palmiformis]
MLARRVLHSAFLGKLRLFPEALSSVAARRSQTDASRRFNSPLTSDQLPRPAGICSMYRLPIQKDTQGLDVCFVGVPIDAGTSNRPGTRFGPRQIRTESVMVRTFNKETGAQPYQSLQVADVGDIYVTMYDIQRAAREIRASFTKLIANGCKTLAMGGDHFITYPILQAYKEKYGAIGLIHIDAHLDVSEHMNGCDITHGTTFRRAYDEGILDPSKVIQIGMRGSGYTPKDYEWPVSKVSPPYDPTGLTSLTAANLLFEMLCVLPGVKYSDVFV